MNSLRRQLRLAWEWLGHAFRIRTLLQALGWWDTYVVGVLGIANAWVLQNLGLSGGKVKVACLTIGSIFLLGWFWRLCFRRTAIKDHWHGSVDAVNVTVKNKYSVWPVVTPELRLKNLTRWDEERGRFVDYGFQSVLLFAGSEETVQLFLGDQILYQLLDATDVSAVTIRGRSHSGEPCSWPLPVEGKWRAELEAAWTVRRAEELKPRQYKDASYYFKWDKRSIPKKIHPIPVGDGSK